MTQFSSSRKARIASLYETHLWEFARAYLYNGQQRVKGLIEYSLGDEISKGDIDLMIAIAQDFAACYELMGFQQQILNDNVHQLPSNAASVS